MVHTYRQRLLIKKMPLNLKISCKSHYICDWLLLPGRKFSVNLFILHLLPLHLVHSHVTYLHVQSCFVNTGLNAKPYSHISFHALVSWQQIRCPFSLAVLYLDNKQVHQLEWMNKYRFNADYVDYWLLVFLRVKIFNLFS